MSILNHFGKVKTTFTPYKNKHIYHNDLDRAVLNANHGTCVQGAGHSYSSLTNKTEDDKAKYIHIRGYFEKYYSTFYHAKYYNVQQDFAEFVNGLVADLSASFWSALNLTPAITLTQLLCLKVDDVDSRVDHLEKMLKQVIDDNKLLQRKIDALEQQKHIKDLRVARSIRVLIQELD
jgi:hypothetical protein